MIKTAFLSLIYSSVNLLVWFTHLKHAGHDEGLVGSAHHDPDVEAHAGRFSSLSLIFLSEQMFGVVQGGD